MPGCPSNKFVPKACLQGRLGSHHSGFPVLGSPPCWSGWCPSLEPERLAGKMTKSCLQGGKWSPGWWGWDKAPHSQGVLSGADGGGVRGAWAPRLLEKGLSGVCTCVGWPGMSSRGRARRGPGGKPSARADGWMGQRPPECQTALEAAWRDLWSGAGQMATGFPVLPSACPDLQSLSVSSETTVCFLVYRNKLGARVHGAGPPSR